MDNFVEPPPPRQGPSYAAPLKLLAASVVGLLLALGLCGVALTKNNLVPVVLAVAAVSALAFVVAIIWLVVAAVKGSASR